MRIYHNIGCERRIACRDIGLGGEAAHSPGIISPFVSHRVTGAEHGCLDTELSHNARASGGNQDCEHVAHMSQSSQLSESAE